MLSIPLTNNAPVLAVGLISGTSADGIDAALVRITPGEARLQVELLGYHSHPYPKEIRSLLFEAFADCLTTSALCLLNARLGDLFADAAEAVLSVRKDSQPLTFVASHGQTVWHQPHPLPEAPEGLGAVRATLQLGEGARIAERLGVPVVCDFRQQDFALGGQGAPLVPYVDYLFFAHSTENRAVQNLGGIGNVTYLPAGVGPDRVIAFDTGPANALMDAAAALATSGRLKCDMGGEIAASAPPEPALLAELMQEPYLLQPPPKSTGRELFSAARVEALWAAGHRGASLVSTLTQYTADTVADAYRRWLGPVDTVILGGGGARNPDLVRRLRDALAPAEVLLNEDFGFDSDAKEAVAFAVLGYETLRGRPSNVPSATGATRLAIQGKVCYP